jgi:hypothetical protein
VLRINATSFKALIALTPTQIVVYQSNGTGWTQQQTVGIDRNAVMPRDPRGHLVAGTDHLFDVYLPGSVCNSNASLPLTLSCHDADDLWPLGGQNAFFSSSRNYFTGLLRPGFGQQVSPFYSAASLPIADRNMWIFTGVDGQVRWTDGGPEQALASASEWGSDIAQLRSGCGVGTQVIATSKAATVGTDSLRAYEVLNQQATAVSAPLSFDGTVTALWSQAGDSQVIATTRTAKGSYETHAISLSCN